MKNTILFKTNKSLFIISVLLFSVLYISCKNPTSPETETEIDYFEGVEPIFIKIDNDKENNEFKFYYGKNNKVKIEYPESYDDKTPGDYAFGKEYEYTYKDGSPIIYSTLGRNTYFYFYNGENYSCKEDNIASFDDLKNYKGKVEFGYNADVSGNYFFLMEDTRKKSTDTKDKDNVDNLDDTDTADTTTTSVNGTYSYEGNSSLEFDGSFTLNDSGEWEYSGNKTNMAATSGSYTTKGSKVTINWYAGGYDYSETFNVTEDGPSVEWSLEEGSFSNFFLMLFGVATQEKLTFTKE